MPQILNQISNWFVLHQLKHSFLRQIHSFLVFGDRGQEVLIVTQNDRVYAFGDNNWPSLALGHREQVYPSEPQEIVELRNKKIIDLTYGHRHVMALTQNGDIYSWGDNRFGQLGSLNTFESLKPMLVGNHIQSLACGTNHTLALTTTGQVFAWGRNNYGQIGIGSNIDQLIPVKVSQLEPFYIKMIRCGGSHSFALTEDGDLYAWGGNSFGQLGIGNCQHQTLPTLVKFTKSAKDSDDFVVKSIACGEYHSLILLSNGEIYSCGRNDSSQLGCVQVPNSEGSCVPVKILCSERFSKIESHFSTNFSMAVSASGYCYVWGDCANNEDRPIREPRQTPLISIQDTFAIYCRKRITPSLYHIDQEERSRMRIMGSRMVERLRQSFNDYQTSDLEFVIDDKSIFVHRWFLQLSSTYLNRMLSDEWIEQGKTIIEIVQKKPSTANGEEAKSEQPQKMLRIKLHSYSYEVFFAYLKYLYTDILELSEVINDDDDEEKQQQQQSLLWLEMLDLSNCYLDDELKLKCVNIMKQHLSTMNCCQYYQLAIRYQLKEFEKEIIIFIYNHIFEVCRSQGFKLMSNDICKKLLISVGEI